MAKRYYALILLALIAIGVGVRAAFTHAHPQVIVGSKKFTESVILGNVTSDLLRGSGYRVSHRAELGGTRLLWDALVAGSIDVYPDYTGTISEEIFAGQNLQGDEQIQTALARNGIRMSRPLGFNDTYAIGMRETEAARLGIRSISDLAKHPELRFGFSNEFMDRKDGWPGLRTRYGLASHKAQGLDHDLAYRGLASGTIDATDLYSTDAEIKYYKIRTLADDLHYFPTYNAVLLYRIDLEQKAPGAVETFLRLEGRIPEKEMIAMNARAKLDKEPETRVAAGFLEKNLDIKPAVVNDSLLQRLIHRTAEHLYLVCISLLAAILVAVPLGVIAAKSNGVGQSILATAGVIQTIPSLALLVFMIPLLGIGAMPAMVALFLYSLLPIIRNTYTGLHDIPISIRESAEALGLPSSARLRLVEMPMSSRSILAGIKTSAVINVGTATLGALIGAGGYGQPILTGIRLDDTGLILEGAIPAALMALAVQGIFELAERGIVPLGLRLEAQS